MEQLDFYYDSINRNAIVVKPKAPFFNWHNDVFPKDKPIHELDDNTIYLIREMDSNQGIRTWLKKNFGDIFVNELNDWSTNKESWPKNRTYKMFADWFDVEVHSMVLDLEESPVTKD